MTALCRDMCGRWMQVIYLGCAESSTSPMQLACFSKRSPTTDLFAAGAFVTQRITDPICGRAYPFPDCRGVARLLNPSLFGPIELTATNPYPTGGRGFRISCKAGRYEFRRSGCRTGVGDPPEWW